MTSVLRRVDQIPARIRYFLLNTPLLYPPSTYPELATTFFGAGVGFFNVPIETALEWGPVGTIVDVSLNDWSATNTSEVVYIGQLYRDTGRSLYVYDPLNTGNLLAIFRQVIRVNGYSSEGIQPPAVATYAKVWQANGFGVMVTRTG